MHEFFQGWRRKAGLATLVMALVLTVAWMRSFVITDDLYLEFGKATHRVHSLHGCLCWIMGNGQQSPMSFQWSSGPPNPHSEPWDDIGYYKGTWRLAGVTIGTGQMQLDFGWSKVNVVVAPYWSLVLPLTLLSAWLILRKTRKATGGTP